MLRCFAPSLGTPLATLRAATRRFTSLLRASFRGFATTLRLLEPSTTALRAFVSVLRPSEPLRGPPAGDVKRRHLERPSVVRRRCRRHRPGSLTKCPNVVRRRCAEVRSTEANRPYSLTKCPNVMHGDACLAKKDAVVFTEFAAVAPDPRDLARVRQVARSFLPQCTL